MTIFVSINGGFGGAEKQFDKLYADLSARMPAADPMPYERHEVSRIGWIAVVLRLLKIRRSFVVYNMSVLGISVFPLMLLKAMGNRILLYPHVVVPPGRSRPRLWLFRAALQRLCVWLADHVVAISDGNLFELEAFTSREKITVVYNYVACENDQPFAWRTPNRDIAVIGRLQDKHKQQLHLLRQHGDLLKECGLTVHLFGSGPDEAELRRHVEQHALEENVIFHGWQDEASIYEHDFSFVLNASRWEGLPLSVLEAIYRDRIVIASDIHGNRELVYNDFLFKDDDDLRRLLLTMVRDGQLQPCLLEAQKRRLYRRCASGAGLQRMQDLLSRLARTGGRA